MNTHDSTTTHMPHAAIQKATLPTGTVKRRANLALSGLSAVVTGRTLVIAHGRSSARPSLQNQPQR